MYVIVRPGPYVCAEWEMGGLPWWLLKKKDVALRTLDPYYMERVGIFMKEVGQQLAPLQINKGGNIIMVQVENEYSSYATDKPYVAAVRDLVRESGFTDVPLFQCDWSSNFTNNALEDLLWTVNFGTGANICLLYTSYTFKRTESFQVSFTDIGYNAIIRFGYFTKEFDFSLMIGTHFDDGKVMFRFQPE